MGKLYCEKFETKTTGSDSLSQEQLAFGANTLTHPLWELVIKSIDTGEFPTVWKEAQVTPALKKGDYITLHLLFSMYYL